MTAFDNFLMIFNILDDLDLNIENFGQVSKVSFRVEVASILFHQRPFLREDKAFLNEMPFMNVPYIEKETLREKVTQLEEKLIMAPALSPVRRSSSSNDEKTSRFEFCVSKFLSILSDFFDKTQK